MARLSLIPAFANSKLFSFFVRFALAAFVCVSLNVAAFAKGSHWTGCRGADFDARIVDCTEIITPVGSRRYVRFR
jgi:hypothetical protein